MIMGSTTCSDTDFAVFPPSFRLVKWGKGHSFILLGVSFIWTTLAKTAMTSPSLFFLSSVTMCPALFTSCCCSACAAVFSSLCSKWVYRRWFVYCPHLYPPTPSILHHLPPFLQTGKRTSSRRPWCRTLWWPACLHTCYWDWDVKSTAKQSLRWGGRTLHASSLANWIQSMSSKERVHEISFV